VNARTGLILMSAAIAAGCAKDSWPKRSQLTSSQAQALNEIAARQQRLDAAAEASFQGEAWAIGAVAWNASMLPVLSPDGHWVAVSSGEAPGTATQLALPGAPPPSDAAIEVWQVMPGYGGLRPVATVDMPCILTDTADDEGFLVESPRPDGSRWIGKVDWRSGTTEWLVRDDAINTMPTIGPGGRLAWCSRTADDGQLSLVIRFRSGREFVLPPDNAEWMFPLWSERSTRLSAFRLTDNGLLQLVSLDGDSADTLTQDARQVTIMTGANRWDAVKGTANRTAVQGRQAPPLEEVIFYHPIEQRMCVWMPTGINADRWVPLAEGSIDATHDDRGNFLLTTAAGLQWQALELNGATVRVDHVPVFARPTTDPMRPFILLDPGKEVVRLRGMRPRRETSIASEQPAAP